MSAEAALHTAAGGSSFVVPLQPALLREPLDCLAAEHARQAMLLAHLERLGRQPQERAARGIAVSLLRWHTEELPVHFAGEEQSLHLRHLELEETEVTPVARRCVTSETLAVFAAEMMARRHPNEGTRCPMAP